jgi:hypothetical protein
MPKKIISSTVEILDQQNLKPKHPGGRPSKYSIELAHEICKVIASSSESLQRMCNERDHWPDRPTIFTWLNKHEEFRNMYTKAKQDQVSAYVDDIVEISDHAASDTILDSKGNEIENREWVNRSRLRVDTRKWLASKLVPRLYGDRIITKDEDVDKDNTSVVEIPANGRAVKEKK